MLIDGAIEIKPFSVDPDIDFIELPWGVGIRKLISFQFLTRYRCIFNKLTVNGRAINGNPTLWQHIADIGITHRGQNVPTWNHLGPCGFTEEGMNSLSFHDNSIFCNKPKYSDAEVAQTLDTAQKHTLTVSKGVLDTAKQYTNTVSSNTLDSANTYTNNKAD